MVDHNGKFGAILPGERPTGEEFMIFLVAEDKVCAVTYPAELIDYYIDLFTGLKEQMEDIKYGSRN